MNVFPLLVAATSSDSAARTAGSAIAVVFLILGIVHCARIMRRHTTSTLCVAALMVFLIGWLGSSLINVASGVLEWPKTVMILWTPFLFLLNIGALVLGIVGLVQFDRTHLVQGRSQAIWAIVLSGLSILGTAVAFGFGVYQATKGAYATKPAKREEFQQFNCAVTPPAAWVRLDPKALGSDIAQVGFRKFGPEGYMMLIAEEVGDFGSLDRFTEVVKGNLAARTDVKQQSEETVKIGNLEFRRVMTTAAIETPRKIDLYYEHWLATQGGYFWQLMVWGGEKDRDAVATDARKFADGFELLDPAKQFSPNGTVKDVERPEWGVSTHVAGTGWFRGGKEFEQNPLVQFSAKRNAEALLVLPLRFEETPPDIEALTKGFLSTMDFSYPLADQVSSKPFKSKAGEGLEIITDRQADGSSYRYILRVVRGERSAYYVAGWADQQKGDLERVRKAMDAIDLQVPEGDMPAMSDGARKELGLVLNQVGLSYFKRKDYEQAAVWFQRAYDKAKDDATVLDNLALSLQDLGKTKEALALIEPEITRFPTSFDLQTRRATLMAINGDPEGGQAHFIELIGRGLKNESDLLAWINQLVSQDRYDLAEAAAQTWNAKQGSPKTRRWHADVIAQSGEPKRAIPILEKLAAEDPQDEKTACKFGEILNQSEDYARASEVMEKFLADGRKSVDALEVLGWSQMGRKWFREAKATFEEAAKARPHDEDLQDAIRSASAALGQGDNSEVKQPIEAVPMPTSLAKELDAITVPEEFGKGRSAIMLVRSTGYHFEKGKPVRLTYRRKVKILDQTGVNAYSTLEFQFHPLHEKIFVNRVQVFDAEGKAVATASVEDSFVRDADDGTANHGKVLNVPVPALQAGSVLEFEVTKEDRGAVNEFPFTRYLFAYRVPCVFEAVYVTGDTAEVKHVTAAGSGIKSVKRDGVVGWIVPMLEPREFESLATSFESRSPVLWLGGGADTWAAVGKGYLSQIADRLKADDAAAKLSAELCSGLKSDREKIAVLARKVQKDVAYKALEFGVRARRPNAPADTLRQRFGDCKDHALVLHQLLKSAGIESHLALVHNEYRIQADLPSLDQFNHMVVHVPALGKGWLIDPTDKQLDLAGVPAGGLWDSHALILDPANPRLIPPPAAPREGSSNVESRRTISREGNDWKVEETLTITGYYAAWTREGYAGRTSAEQARRAQEVLSGVGVAELKQFAFENLDDVAQPARLTMTYIVRNGVKGGPGKASAVLPALWEREYLGLGYVEKRQTPFLFRYPFRFNSIVTLKLPKSATVGALARRSSNKFSAWELAAEAPSQGSGDAWTIKFNFRVQPGEWPAKEYAAFYESWESARRAWETAVEWRGS
ncbi:DUF3857 domain-containing protein [Verrucomicrobiota bacterium sgz303538]